MAAETLRLPATTAAPPMPASIDRTLTRIALAGSLALHAAVLFLGPAWRPAPHPPAPPLLVRLYAPRPAAPEPVPSLPAEPFPQPIAEVRPAAPPLAAKAPPPTHPETAPAKPRPLLARAPSSAHPALRIEQAVAAPTPEPVAAPASPAAVPPQATAALSVQASPTEAAPTPAPARPSISDPALLARYGDTLSHLFASRQAYPRVAALRGWEGEVVLRLVIARKGALVAVKLIRSSGHEVLDDNAQALITAAAPFPPPPAAPAGGEDIEVTVPVRYHLDKKA